MWAMTERSLRASPEGIRRANKAVLIFATKGELAIELEISQATVQSFLPVNWWDAKTFTKFAKS